MGPLSGRAPVKAMRNVCACCLGTGAHNAEGPMPCSSCAGTGYAGGKAPKKSARKGDMHVIESMVDELEAYTAPGGPHCPACGVVTVDVPGALCGYCLARQAEATAPGLAAYLPKQGPHVGPGWCACPTIGPMVELDREAWAFACGSCGGLVPPSDCACHDPQDAPCAPPPKAAPLGSPRDFWAALHRAEFAPFGLMAKRYEGEP